MLYRRGRTWWIKLKRRGQTIRRSTGTSVRAQAQEYEDRLRAQLWRVDAFGDPAPVTWEQAVAKWMKLKTRGLPDRYRLRAMPIDPNELLPLPKPLIERALEPMASAGAYNRTLAVILAVHHASGLEAPKIARRKMPAGRTRWLTLEEWQRLRRELEARSPLLAKAAEFSLATGLRENNVLELTWNQVDLRRRVAWLHGDQVKNRAAIGVPLNDAAMRVLEARRGIDRVLVFGNPDYALTKASNRAWYDAIRASKLKSVRWHDLRHTWASWAVMSGVRLNELQALGGWKTAQMVQRYAHLAPEHLAAAAALVAPVSLRRRAAGSAENRRERGTKRVTMGG